MKTKRGDCKTFVSILWFAKAIIEASPNFNQVDSPHHMLKIKEFNESLLGYQK